MSQIQGLLKLWGRKNSSNVQKVSWLLGELGLDYEEVTVGGKAGGLDTPQFLALNPHGRIPLLEHNGAAIWESHTILRYLAATANQAPFWPASPAARAVADGWLDWTLASLQPAFAEVFIGFYRTPPEQRNLAQLESSLKRLNGHFQLLDQQLAQRAFIGGDTLSLADFGAGTLLHRYFNIEIDRPALPHLQDLYQRLGQRPAYAAHVAVAFDELRG